LITLGVLGTFLIVMFRRDYRAAHPQRGAV
jgi:hypothetical protein